jgi:hypothetical protein
VPGEVRLLLVEVDRDQLERHRCLLLQLQQDVEHGVAVLAAGQAHHHLVAILDHAEVGDSAADLVAQALGQLVLLMRALVGARQRLGEGQGQGHSGREQRVGHSTVAVALTVVAPTD